MANSNRDRIFLLAIYNPSECIGPDHSALVLTVDLAQKIIRRAALVRMLKKYDKDVSVIEYWNPFAMTWISYSEDIDNLLDYSDYAIVDRATYSSWELDITEVDCVLMRVYTDAVTWKAVSKSSDETVETHELPISVIQEWLDGQE